MLEVPSQSTEESAMKAKVIAASVTGSLGIGTLVLLGGVPTMQATAASPSAYTCSQPLPTGSEPVTLDPADFVATVDNRYWPMSAGRVWAYRESDASGDQSRVRVEVLSRTKNILGITATVVHDTVKRHGELLENTFDWYAQDVCDNIWYLGENTREYEKGQVVSREGSWQAGVDGAQAGVALPGAPTPGLEYRQEYYAGHAEDEARVLSIDEQAKVELGHYDKLLMTRDTVPLEPRIQEYKFYAEDVGLVLALTVSGGSGREELIRVHD
jgi:hypothetical protein